MQTPIRGEGKHQLIVLREQGKRKMSSALSFALPLKSLQINGRNGGVILGKQQMGRRERRMAMAAQGSDSLDHLQRAARYRQHRQQPHPKQRIAAVAPFGLWDRFPSARTVQQMMETMERIMEDPLGYPSVVDESGPSYRRGGRTPWEIKEDENEYKMRFDMPGMTKTDVKVSLEEKTLVIQAEKQTRKSPEGEEQEDAEEWPAKSYGRYSSRIGLPENIEMEKIKAEVRDGVLYVTIPKAKTVNKVLDINVQ